MTEPTVRSGSTPGAVAAEPFATLEQAMAWCQQMQATIRFYKEPEGQRIRIAVHTDPRDPEHIAVAVLPLGGDGPATLAATIEAARQEIEPQIRRQHFRLVLPAGSGHNTTPL